MRASYSYLIALVSLQGEMPAQTRVQFSSYVRYNCDQIGANARLDSREAPGRVRSGGTAGNRKARLGDDAAFGVGFVGVSGQRSIRDEV